MSQVPEYLGQGAEHRAAGGGKKGMSVMWLSRSIRTATPSRVTEERTLLIDIPRQVSFAQLKQSSDIEHDACELVVDSMCIDGRV